MEKVVITLHQDKVTKNTTRYEQEVGTGEKLVTPTIYINTASFDGPAPSRIQVTIEDASEG